MDELYLDPLRWGYGLGWWRQIGRAPVINTGIETTAESWMFKPLWPHGRGLVMADG